jgi:hypothetical protein
MVQQFQRLGVRCLPWATFLLCAALLKMTKASSADRLGKVFYPVRSDIEGNIKKLQAIAKTKPNGVTLQALVREEKVADTSKVKLDHKLVHAQR